MNKLNLIPLSLASLTILTGTILASSIVSADNDSVVDEINITVPVSCTMNGSGMNTHNAEVSNGQYNSSIGETTLKAFCNDNEGFAIYAIGYTDNEEGKNVLTNSTLGSTYDITTGTAISGNDSQWAMKLAKLTSPAPTYPIIIAGSTEDSLKAQGDPDYSTFQEVPDDYTKVAYRTSATDTGTNAEGATLTTTYQAYISKTQPAGTYTGQVKYTLVHPHNAAAPYLPHEVPCTPNTICYSANANDIVGGMGNQSLSEADKIDWSSCAGGTDYSTYCYNAFGGRINIDSLPKSDYYIKTLHAPNYSRQGYGFAGWNDKYDYSGNSFGPNEEINIDDETASEGLTLYAVWLKPQGDFQSWRECSSMARNQVIALTDNRDGQTYTVAKLADDKCWMTENLRLDDSVILSNSNTNNPALPLVNSYDGLNPVISNHLSATSTDWCSSFGSECVNQSFLNTDNTTLYQSNNTGDQSSNVYNYGNYYNWYSATAGNGTYDMNSGTSSGDICPFGWTLPTSGSSTADYNILDVAINADSATRSKMFRAYPLNYVYSDYITGTGSANRRGTAGIYWSSNAISNEKAISLFINSNIINFSWDANKQDHLSTRCLLKTN